MSRTTLRIVIILAGLSITGITVTQIYWVRKAFDLRENQFYRDVHSALRSVAQRIYDVNHTPPSPNPVSQVATNHFIVLVDGPIDAGELEFLLVSEFEKRNVRADFEYGIYDCAERCMGSGAYIHTQKVALAAPFPANPGQKDNGYYFAVQFPGLQADLISQMGIWGFSSIVMLVVIFFFVYTLFVILRQRRLSEVQRDFINNMTHEFKTPISTISISSEVLKDPAIIQAPERLLNYATLIGQESRRLEQQVERVLQTAAVEKEDLALRLETTDVHELIRGAVGSCQAALEARTGRIELKLDAQPAHIRADKMHFTNVLYNLLDNAIKYCQRSPVITVSTQRMATHLTISVADNGMGIAPDQLHKIFQKFYRVSTGNLHDVKGFGLGLYYVKMIVERHGGHIRLESKPGTGSTFTLTLPAL